jgi:hypothetical protein
LPGIADDVVIDAGAPAGVPYTVTLDLDNQVVNSLTLGGTGAPVTCNLIGKTFRRTNGASLNGKKHPV